MDQSRRRLLQASSLALLAPAWLGASSPGLGARTTADEATRGIDLRGKTALVTGCTSGIGLETMRVLALRGAHVIGTGRTLEKAGLACRTVAGRTTPIALELAEFESVRACAREIDRLDVPIDMLICNAGIVLGSPEQALGLEKHFVVNHLGHYVLVRGLLPRVVASPQGRIVVLGSGDHRNAPAGGIQFDRLSGEGWADRGYSHSKLANGLFSLELSRRLRGTRASSNCVSPGHVRTNILRSVGNRYRSNARPVAQGAATPCYLAAHPDLAGVTGGYFRDFAPAPQSVEQTDTAMAARLWEVSETLVGSSTGPASPF
jgi:NAD(P)-dependent dehydrogenase (short-subunit alcohol dehydrogenase family)